MKNNLPLVAAALMAAGIVSSAQASYVVVRITGSTAYRNNANNVLNTGGKVFDNTPTVLGPAFNQGNNQMVFSNTIAGANVVIKTSFTGSEAGIASLVGQSIINPTPANSSAVVPGTPTPSFLADDGTAGPDVTAPDIAFADTSKSVSLTQDSRILDKGIVGIVQFVWMKGANLGQANWAHLSNITIPQLNVMLGSGRQDLSFLTGIANDFGTPVAVFGRNKGSGSRVNTLVQALYGITKPVSQNALTPTYNGNGQLVDLSKTTGQAIFNDAAVTGIANNGYDSGGAVRAVISAVSAGGAVTIIPIGYMSLGDSSAVQALVNDNSVNATAPSGGQYLTVNGVLYSDQAINNGSYDMWGHEHVLTGPSTSTTGNTVASKLISNMPATAIGGSSGLSYNPISGTNPNGTLFVDRAGGGDTGFVTPL